MSYHSPIQFLNLLSLIKDSHLVGIRQVRALNLSVNKLKYAIAAAACAYTRMLAKDDKKRTEFYDEPFWDDQQRFHRDKDLLHVLMYIENAKEGGNYKLASAHSISLQALCDDADIKDEDLAQHIKDEGGFSGLIVTDDSEEGSLKTTTDAEASDDASEETATLRPGTSPSIFAGEDDLNDSDEDETDTADSADEVVNRPVRKPAKPAESLKRLSRGYVEHCILGRPAAEDREAILSPLRAGKSVWVKLVPGQILDRYELYEGGGGFIDATIEDYEVEG